MAVLENFIKLFTIIFLIFGLSNTYANKQQSVDIAETSCGADPICDVISDMTTIAAEPADAGMDTASDLNSCDGIVNCTVAVSCEDNPNADACYSAPESTVKPNIATRKYMENGCEVTEYEQDAVMDCSMKDKKK